MVIRIKSSVGKGGKNFPNDVKCIQALINVYLRSIGEPPTPVTGVSSTALETAINLFQINHMALTTTADFRVDANGKTLKRLTQLLADVFKPLAVTTPTSGVVTWESEGAEGGRYHSRKLHVPSTSSGLTVGRGYDFRRKSKAKIKADLVACGLATTQADPLSGASGLFGSTAAQFIIDKDLLDFQLSPSQQKALFKISYDEEASEVQRICEKADVEKLYGKTDWANLNSTIKDITIDLKFRGDYTGPARKLIQKSISDNNLEDFKKLLKNRAHWALVPQDRFDRRVAFLDKI